MADEPRVEWVPRDFFAECAEALGISTNEVFSSVPTPNGGAAVIYTPGVTEENVETVTTYHVLLLRDADGILRKHGAPVVIPDFFARIKRRLASELGEDENDG